jgi:hypothetical protein
MILPAVSLDPFLDEFGISIVLSADPLFEDYGDHVAKASLAVEATPHVFDDFADISFVDDASVEQNGHQISDHHSANCGDHVGRVAIDDDGSLLDHLNLPTSNQ